MNLREFENRKMELKQYAKNHNVPMWKLGGSAGFKHDTSFSRAIRTMSAEQLKNYKKIIDGLAAESE